MIKKMCFFLSVIIITALSGCGSSPQKPDIKHNVDILLNDFKTAVEAYNVDGMLACLFRNDFSLTIQEAGFSEIKNYTTLADELQSDKTNQLNWRKPVADGGYNYKLELELGAPTLSNTSNAGTFASTTFEVWESAEGFNRLKTDNGVITWQIVKNGGEWKTATMTIEYQPLNASGLSLSKAKKNGSKGFGFSRLPLSR